MRRPAPAHEVVIDSRWHYLRGDEVVIVSHWRMTFDGEGKLHLAVDGERAGTLPPLPRIGLNFEVRTSINRFLARLRPA